ncbi:MAG TPA: hypothetical protein VF635_00630 [Propionibacteriaceae bacterium]
MTTIKVSRELRGRIAALARDQHVSLATVISRALDVSSERAFWLAVHKENQALTDDERATSLADATIADHLDDEMDASISTRKAW